MTILHLIRSYGSNNPGGAEINLTNLVKLSSNSLKTQNIILSDYGIWKSSIKNSKYKLVRHIKFSLIMRNIFIFNSQNIKTIHVHSNGFLMFYGFFLAIIFKATLIIKVTRIGEQSIFNRSKDKKFNIKVFIYRLLLKLFLKSKFVYVHLLTQSAVNIIQKSTKNIIIFPNLIEKGEYDKSKKVENTFLIASRLIKRKNIDLTLQKLTSLENFNQLTINIIGTGPELNNLKIKYKEFSKNIFFKGRVEHGLINKFYIFSEYFINLSDSEGMSNSLIEAMSYGCKCIISDIPENRDTAQDQAIYFDNSCKFMNKLIQAQKLDCEKISNFSNNQYSIDSINLSKIKELYKIENNYSSRRVR